MGRVVDLPLPRLGETMEEGRIGQLLKKPGDKFRRGEILLEVESDKTTVEVPALHDGILVGWLVKSDDTVAVESAIARIEIEGEAAAIAKPRESAPVAPALPAVPMRQSTSSRIRASTAARAEARRRGIDLAAIRGTGRNGRMTKADLSTISDSVRSIYIIETKAGKFAIREWPAVGPERGKALLLHGLFADAQSFTTLGRKLAARGLQTLAIDLPGHGGTACPADNPEAIADAVAEAVSPSGLHLVGHSFGAVAASIMAAKFGAKSLTLLAPGGLGREINMDFLQLMLDGRTAEALSLLGEKVPRESVQGLAAQIAANGAQFRSLIASITEAGGQREIVDLLASLTIPVSAVLLHGDRIIPARQAMNLPPNVAVHILPGDSHIPHWRVPDFIASLVVT